MSSKRFRVIILWGLFIVLISVGAVALSGALDPANAYRIRTVRFLSEMLKPPIIDHSEIVTTRMIVYPKPRLTVDDKILRDLNCPFEDSGNRYCFAAFDHGQSQSLGCYSIYTPDALLGGLQPNYPITACSVGNGEYVYQTGCMINVGITYIIERQGKYERIDSLSKLKSVYAPIESEDEALSYAIAATGYSALYTTNILTDTEYFVEKLENTHVEERGNEFVVRLYNYSLCGCRQHQTIAIDVAVSRAGEIREVYREKVYRDGFYSCID